MSDAKPSESRVGLVLRTFLALPVFLLLTVICWELVLCLWLLSDWLDVRGWPAFGMSARVIWIMLAVVTIIATAVGFFAWIGRLVRVIRGREV